MEPDPDNMAGFDFSNDRTVALNFAEEGDSDEGGGPLARARGHGP